jgi:GR25 family glycosyltransferase involved in LPS biosynthesis
VLKSLSKEAQILQENGQLCKSLEIYCQLKIMTGLSSWDYNIKKIVENLNKAEIVHYPIGKTGEALIHKLGIDKVYVSNLKRRPDRLSRVKSELDVIGLTLSETDIWLAVDGSTDPDAIRMCSEYRGKTYKTIPSEFKFISNFDFEVQRNQVNPSVFGYILTQKKIFEDAVKNGYERIVVFDDDIYFTETAANVINRFCSYIDSWDIVMLGASDYSIERQLAPSPNKLMIDKCCYYRPIPLKTCGSFAIAYSKTVFNDLLNVIDSGLAPFDKFLLAKIFHENPDTCYVLYPNVAVPDVSDSDIRGVRDVLTHSIKMGWDVSRIKQR